MSQGNQGQSNQGQGRRFVIVIAIVAIVFMVIFVSGNLDNTSHPTPYCDEGTQSDPSCSTFVPLPPPALSCSTNSQHPRTDNLFHHLGRTICLTPAEKSQTWPFNGVNNTKQYLTLEINTADSSLLDVEVRRLSEHSYRLAKVINDPREPENNGDRWIFEIVGGPHLLVIKLNNTDRDSPVQFSLEARLDSLDCWGKLTTGSTLTNEFGRNLDPQQFATYPGRTVRILSKNRDKYEIDYPGFERAFVSIDEVNVGPDATYNCELAGIYP